MTSKFTTRPIKAAGRRSTVLGEKTHTRYEGGGFTVTYRSLPATLRNPERLHVAVTIKGHGTYRWECMEVAPSEDIARMHAASAFRVHFKVSTGDPGKFEGRKLATLVANCHCH